MSKLKDTLVDGNLSVSGKETFPNGINIGGGSLL